MTPRRARSPAPPGSRRDPAWPIGVTDPRDDLACGTAWIGCSGWNYPDWRGVVYPTRVPKRRWFELYASMFDTVELNNTFYRLPPETTVKAWAAAAPEGSCTR